MSRKRRLNAKAVSAREERERIAREVTEQFKRDGHVITPEQASGYADYCVSHKRWMDAQEASSRAFFRMLAELNRNRDASPWRNPIRMVDVLPELSRGMPGGGW